MMHSNKHAIKFQHHQTENLQQLPELPREEWRKNLSYTSKVNRKIKQKGMNGKLTADITEIYILSNIQLYTVKWFWV